jgi:predicted nucleic-acid-binding protein
MIGLDTNVLVRYLVEDDEAQAAAAVRTIEDLSADDPGFVSMVVIVELVWVLRRSYRIPEVEIIPIIEKLLSSDELRLERAEVIRQAARDAMSTSADFADALIGRLGLAAGCGTTVTFDRSAADLPGMSLVEVG